MDRIYVDIRGLFSFPVSAEIKLTGIARTTIEWAKRFGVDDRFEFTAHGISVASRNLMGGEPDLARIGGSIREPASLVEKATDWVNFRVPSPTTKRDILSRARRAIASRSLQFLSTASTSSFLKRRSRIHLEKFIFFVPFVRPLPGSLPSNCIPVMNVFDLIPLTFKDPTFGETRSYHRSIQRVADLGGEYVVNSRDARHALISMFSVSPDRVHVVPLGVDQPSDRDRLQMERTSKIPYFVYVCSDVQRRKNIPFTIRAFSRYLDLTDSSHEMKIVGGGTDKIGTLIESNAGKWLHRIQGTGRVTDEELRALYRGADAGLYPSLCEGFGLPVLEYMRHDLPVICSNVTSLPEVAGDAALLIDPFSEEQMAQAMVRITTDNTLRQSLIENGRIRVARFSWEESTNSLLKVFESILSRAN